MKPLFLGIALGFLCGQPASAQHTFLHNLQREEGQGKVKVHQSDAISKLVNGTPTVSSPKKTAVPSRKNTPAHPSTAHKTQSRTAAHVSEKQREETERREKEERMREVRRELDSIRAHQAEERREESRSHTLTPAEKAAAKRERYEAFLRAPKRKARGYRVQVYAGDNTRRAKNKAHSVAVQVKNYFPELAVYTHFVSPRWVCRAGDFRSFGEAKTYLGKIRAKKFREALIVKTTILVVDR